MTENQLDIVLEKIKKSKDSNYKIAQATGITEATIGNYKKGKTKPTNANLRLLLKYFSDIEKSNQVISGDNNLLSGGDLKIRGSEDFSQKKLNQIIENLRKQLIEKDHLIKKLIDQQEKLISKL